MMAQAIAQLALAISCVLLAIVTLRHTNQLKDIERRLLQLERQSRQIQR